LESSGSGSSDSGSSDEDGEEAALNHLTSAVIAAASPGSALEAMAEEASSSHDKSSKNSSSRKKNKGKEPSDRPATSFPPTVTTPIRRRSRVGNSGGASSIGSVSGDHSGGSGGSGGFAKEEEDDDDGGGVVSVQGALLVTHRALFLLHHHCDGTAAAAASGSTIGESSTLAASEAVAGGSGSGSGSSPSASSTFTVAVKVTPDMVLDAALPYYTMKAGGGTGGSSGRGGGDDDNDDDDHDEVAVRSCEIQLNLKSEAILELERQASAAVPLSTRAQWWWLGVNDGDDGERRAASASVPSCHSGSANNPNKQWGCQSSPLVAAAIAAAAPNPPEARPWLVASAFANPTAAGGCGSSGHNSSGHGIKQEKEEGEDKERHSLIFRTASNLHRSELLEVLSFWFEDCTGKMLDVEQLTYAGSPPPPMHAHPVYALQKPANFSNDPASSSSSSSSSSFPQPPAPPKFPWGLSSSSPSCQAPTTLPSVDSSWDNGQGSGALHKDDDDLVEAEVVDNDAEDDDGGDGYDETAHAAMMKAKNQDGEDSGKKTIGKKKRTSLFNLFSRKPGK
jgi:hypothetical protein